MNTNVRCESSIHLTTYRCGPLDNNAYIIEYKPSNERILIDAPIGSFGKIPIPDYTQLHVILTHGHWDHMAEAHAFQAKGAQIYAHQADAFLIEDPSIMAFLLPQDFPILPAKINHFLEHNSLLTIAGISLQVKHVPGHSPGSIALYCQQNRCLFSGDTLFAQGIVGRTDLPGGNTRQLFDSLQREFASLPPDTHLYSGHGRPCTVGQSMAFLY